MPKKIKSLEPIEYEKIAASIPSYNKVISDWKKSRRVKLKKKELANLFTRGQNMLEEILGYFYGDLGIKGKWHIIEFVDLGDQFFIVAKEKYLQIHVELGINKKGFFLVMTLIDDQNLPLMPDQFWLELLQLSKFGAFSFEEMQVLGDEVESDYPELYNNKVTGNLFIMVRNMIAHQILEGDSMDLGSLLIDWDFKKYPVEKVIENGAAAFKQMYLLNIRLVKANKVL